MTLTENGLAGKVDSLPNKLDNAIRTSLQQHFPAVKIAES
jgi:hypothetical protein